MAVNVMLVDDQQVIREALKTLFQNVQDIAVVEEASSGLDAIEKVTGANPDVILIDLQMGGMNGLQAARIIRDISDSKIILLTVHHDESLIKEAHESGISAYLLKTVSKDQLVETIRKVHREEGPGRRLTPEKIVSSDQESVVHLLASSQGKPAADDMLLHNIVAMVASVESKDAYTFGHSQKVAHWSSVLARITGQNGSWVEQIRTAALVHDVGKIAIPDDILLSRSSLTPEQWVYVKRHPDAGADMLEGAGVLEDICEAVRFHHERIDGSGYPRGLTGEDIPYAARVIAVADAYDAMISDRAYRPALNYSKAQAELSRVSGKQLDAKLVDLFLSCLPKSTKAKSR